MRPTRLVIYAKDIQGITGRSYPYASKLLRAIRKQLRKTRNQPITIDEFCVFTGIEKNMVVSFLSE